MGHVNDTQDAENKGKSNRDKKDKCRIGQSINDKRDERLKHTFVFEIEEKTCTGASVHPRSSPFCHSTLLIRARIR